MSLILGTDKGYAFALPQGLPDKASIRMYELWQGKKDEKAQNARSNGTRGRREETRDVAGLGYAVFHNDSIIALKEGGLHVADLPPLTMDWPKYCKSRMDSSDLTNIREHLEPRTQAAYRWQCAFIEQRGCRSRHAKERKTQ